MDEPLPIIVYRDGLLAYSETFVRDQAEGLERFTPYYAGSRRVEGLKLPEDRTMVVNGGGPSGRAAEVLYKLSGVAPGFYRRVGRVRPVLVHAHFGPDGVSAMPLAHRLGVPLLTTFHGFDATMTDEHARRSFYRHRAYIRGREKLQHEGRLFLAVSEYVRGRLLDAGFPREKVVVHHNGVDTRLFHADPEAEREPVVLFVGRLVEKKGCEYLVRAMSLVQEDVPGAELVVVGTGPLRPGLEELAARTLRRYRFLGALPPGEVRAWMGRASVLSVPSVTASTGDAEGFGLVFAEAQAMRLPVASFDGGPVPEVVAHGETGFLAAEGDWGVLAGYITKLLEDGDLRRRMGERGVERVREKFDLAERTRVLEELYASVLRSGDETSI